MLPCVDRAEVVCDPQTGRPKGVVTRHSALAAQVSSIVEYWQWREDVSNVYRASLMISTKIHICDRYRTCSTMFSP
jgi:hypothetical protein